MKTNIQQGDIFLAVDYFLLGNELLEWEVNKVYKDKTFLAHSLNFKIYLTNIFSEWQVYKWL